METIGENSMDILKSIRLLRPEEVRNILSISRSFVYKLLESGEIPVVRIGKTVRVRPQDLKAYIERSFSPGLAKNGVSRRSQSVKHPQDLNKSMN